MATMLKRLANLTQSQLDRAVQQQRVAREVVGPEQAAEVPDARLEHGE
jgi:hypothetical protein